MNKNYKELEEIIGKDRRRIAETTKKLNIVPIKINHIQYITEKDTEILLRFYGILKEKKVLTKTEIENLISEYTDILHDNEVSDFDKAYYRTELKNLKIKLNKAC